MIINQANIRSMSIGYSVIFNKALAETPTTYQQIATTVPSTTRDQSYNWLGQMPQMREWIGDREIQNLSAYDYVIKNKKFEMTIAVPRDDIEDDTYGVYNPMFQNLGECAARTSFCTSWFPGRFSLPWLRGIMMTWILIPWFSEQSPSYLYVLPAMFLPGIRSG